MERVIALARHDTEAAERVVVATEIQRLIEKSGLSRAAFASHIGTSTSRLSTYATGKVVPSAALLVRMRSVAEADSGSARAANGFVSLAGSWRIKISDDFG
jgi:DNA-binding transcriptional regulator YiaG